MKNRLKDIMLGFEGKRVLVIGDLMLDKSTKGKVTRVSPEAPVPVLEIEEETYSAGGAGNAAVNVSTLGGKAKLSGIIGNDEEGVILLNTIENHHVDCHSILKEWSKTIKKERIICGQQLARLDWEAEEHANTEEKLLNSIQKHLNNIDAIIFCDYDKGTLTEKLCQEIIKNFKKIIVADAKPLHLNWFKGSSLVTLNNREAIEFFGRNAPIEEIAKGIHSLLKTPILITRGKDPSVLCDSEITQIPVPTAHFVDKSGSGDTAAATLALSLASGSSLQEAATLANHASGIVISKPGISTVTISEVLGVLRHDISKDLRENMEVKQAVIDGQLDKIEKLADYIMDVYRNHKKILVFGNGGSAADAQHFAAELVGRYKMERKGLPAIALTTDTSIITAVANDYSYDDIFKRQVEALANKGDLVVGITTSGNSP